MRRIFAAALPLALLLFLIETPAEARGQIDLSNEFTSDGRYAGGGSLSAPVSQSFRKGKRGYRASDRGSIGGGFASFASRSSLGPKPRMWCGWWMRQQTGQYDPSLNLARNWLRFPRTSASPGAIVVWARGRGGHVGKIVQMTGPCTALVISGNDGRAVRTRERNICNALGIVRA